MWRLALADYRERTRRFGFLFTLGLTLWAAYMFVPPNGATYTTLRMGEYRGVYNSAWVGTLVALETVVFLGLAGFYLVKNTIARDLSTRVGELLAASGTTSGRYLLAKMLSNWAVLSTILAVSLVAAGLTQLVRGESMQIEPIALLLPFLLISLPMMALVSSCAVLFETVRWTRGGLGNVVYYFLWMAVLIMGMPGAGMKSGLADPSGTIMVMGQIQESCQRAFPDFDPEKDGMSLGINIRADGQQMHLATFEWQGLEWDWSRLAARFVWLGAAFLLLLPTRALFDRQMFTERDTGVARKRSKDPQETEVEVPEETVYTGSPVTHSAFGASFLAAPLETKPKWRPGALVMAELRLAFKGTNLWWYIVALGLVVGCLLAPLSVVRSFIFPMAWIWPLLKWSPLGTRERQFGTDGMLFSAPSPVGRQLPSAWLAGVLIALATGSGMAVRLAVSGEFQGLFGWLVGALFIPTLAICLGSLSASGKAFEILYLILWYGGPVNAVPLLDYMGASEASVASGMPWRYLMVTALLAAVAVAARFKSLRK